MELRSKQIFEGIHWEDSRDGQPVEIHIDSRRDEEKA